jgi:mono/diheme cytochrome c family protein
MTKFIKIAMIAVAVMFAFACTQTGPQTNSQTPNNAQKAVAATPVPKATIDELAMGANVYEANCVACHKPDGSGGNVVIYGKTLDAASFLSEHMIKHDEAKLIKHIMEGDEEDGMPAFKDKLSEGELRAVVLHIRELQKEINLAPVANKVQPQ